MRERASAAGALRGSDLAQDDGFATEPAIPGRRASEGRAERRHLQRFQLGEFRWRRKPVKRRAQRRARQLAEQRQFGGILRQLHRLLLLASGSGLARLGHLRQWRSAANGVRSAHHVLGTALRRLIR